MKNYRRNGRAVKADTVQMAFGSFSFCLFEMAFMIERRTLVQMVSEYEIETFKDKNAQ